MRNSHFSQTILQPILRYTNGFPMASPLSGHRPFWPADYIWECYTNDSGWCHVSKYRVSTVYPVDLTRAIQHWPSRSSHITALLLLSTPHCRNPFWARRGDPLSPWTNPDCTSICVPARSSTICLGFRPTSQSLPEWPNKVRKLCVSKMAQAQI